MSIIIQGWGEPGGHRCTLAWQPFFQNPHRQLSDYQVYRKELHLADQAEPLGYQSIWGVEHHFTDYTMCPDVLQFLSYMAGRTERAKLGSAVVVLPWHNPLRVADEPTSMLDVSSRTAIMNLMLGLAQNLGITYLYITHDLAVARYMCQRVGVMYMGKLVEVPDTEDLLLHPQHPYTQALLSAVPVPDPAFRREPVALRGEATQPVAPPARCRFYDRGPLAVDQCRDNPHPALEAKAGAGHRVACYRM